MRRDIGVIALVLAFALASVSEGCTRGAARVQPAQSSPLALALQGAPAPRLVPARVCASTGAVEPLGGGRSRVDAGGMRAEIPGDSSRTAEIAFTYGGPSQTSTPLANGELRRQIGLKLRARDTCNVVYVMWRIAPASGVFVSVKRNPGMSTHAECGDRGYENLRNARGAATPAMTTALVPGTTHTLRAAIAEDERTLRVFADGDPVFEAVLPGGALTFDGPAGVRSDNVRFDFELRVPQGAAGGGDARTATCAEGAERPATARGVWVWSTNSRLDDPRGTSSLLETCRIAGLNEVYLSVNNGVLTDERLPALVLALRDRGIRVEALMGDATWYRPDARAPMLAMIDAVAAYDARHPRAAFAAVHLDVEPHQIHENKGNHGFLPELARALHEATRHAARSGLGSSADLPRFALDEQGPAFAAAVDRPFVMLYQLRDRSPEWLVRQSRSVLAHTYPGTSDDLASRLVIGLRVEDYPTELATMTGALDRGHGERARYAGWAVHDETKFRARYVNGMAERQGHDASDDPRGASSGRDSSSSPSR